MSTETERTSYYAVDSAKRLLEQASKNLASHRLALDWLQEQFLEEDWQPYIISANPGYPEVNVYFSSKVLGAAAEEISRYLRSKFQIKESRKEADIWHSDSIVLITSVPFGEQKINLRVEGGEITEGCHLEPQTFTTYKLVCK